MWRAGGACGAAYRRGDLFDKRRNLMADWAKFLSTAPAVGDNVVDRYPEQGVFYPGGNAVNVAVHGRRCGAATAYIGAAARTTRV